MMDQRNMLIAGAIAVAVILAYYFFTNETPAPKKVGTSQYYYYAIAAPIRWAPMHRSCRRSSVRFAA